MNPNDYFVWNVGPDIVTIGPLTLRWYSMLFALSFFVGLQMMAWIYSREEKPQKDLDRLFLYMMAGTIIGARLGHILFYDPAYYFSHPLDILKVWEGGLASHGGAAGIFIALYLYTRKRPDQPYLWLLDRMAIPVALAGAFIRLGNLFNSEIYGKPTTVAWAIVFQRVDSLPRHPVQLYESITYLGIFFLLFLLYRKTQGEVPQGQLFGLFLVSVFGARFFLEFFKVRQAAYGQTFFLSVGQMLSIPLVIAGLYFLVRSYRQPHAAARAG